MTGNRIGQTGRKRRPVLARTLFLAFLGLALAGIDSFAALFAPSAELWPKWQAHDPASTLEIDHGPFDRLLDARVTPGSDGIARFDYAAVTQEERAALDDYVAMLADLPVTRLNRDQQRAVWIDLYNALTLQVVLAHYPVASIRDIDISPGLFASGPWDAELVTVEGEAVTLNDIEHRILRPIWNDPRLHYAVNCASLGCPDLQAKAFTAENTEQLLEAGARAYVNHPRGVTVEGGAVEVSSLYAWFEEDFGGSDAGILAHIQGYADEDLAKALDGMEQIEGHDYDWALNAP